MLPIFASFNMADGWSFVERLYNKHKHRMLAAAFAVLNNLSDAEDAVQKVFSDICARDPSALCALDPGHIGSYLESAAMNAAVDIIRARHGKVSLEAISASGHEPSNDGGLMEWACRYSDSKALTSAIASLAPMYSEVLRLYYYEQLSAAEISRLLGVKPGTVRKRLSRGRLLLRKKLEETGGVFYDD